MREREKPAVFMQEHTGILFNGHGHLFFSDFVRLCFARLSNFSLSPFSVQKSKLTLSSVLQLLLFLLVALYNSQSACVWVLYCVRADRVSSLSHSLSLSRSLALRYLKSRLRMRGCHSMPYYQNGYCHNDSGVLNELKLSLTLFPSIMFCL